MRCGRHSQRCSEPPTSTSSPRCLRGCRPVRKFGWPTRPSGDSRTGPRPWWSTPAGRCTHHDGARHSPATIDPPANEWTLPECVAEHETVTVHVPVSGVPPKADVYLLADTTGSMSSIIGAVQAGIGAVVSDPAFAGFDVAWGAGNYKDFPIPASSPYAFQHQLSPTLGSADVTLAVNAWSASGGDDTPEGQLFALQQIATDPAIGWRPDSKRILVWIRGPPRHDSVCAAISGVADIT